MPWDDAVTLVLTYAEIPFTAIYDEEVLSDQLILYDWVIYIMKIYRTIWKVLVHTKMYHGTSNKRKKLKFSS
jgi:hypothetical protein